MAAFQEIESGTLVKWLEDNKRFRLIDVRSMAEFTQGMIPGGEQLPLHLLPLRADELDRGADIVLYCRSGARSAQACSFLSERGFESVYNLRGGIMDWARNGFPLVQGAQ